MPNFLITEQKKPKYLHFCDHSQCYHSWVFRNEKCCQIGIFTWDVVINAKSNFLKEIFVYISLFGHEVAKVQISRKTKQNRHFLTGNHGLAYKMSLWSVFEAREASNWLKLRCFHLDIQRIMKNTVTRVDIFPQTLTQLAFLHGIWLTSKVSTTNTKKNIEDGQE